MPHPQKLPRICISATGSTAGELMECARRALKQSRFVELRLDWVANPADAIVLIPKLLADRGRSAARAAILQATCRRKSNGGRFTGSVARQLELLHRAAAAGCRVLDFEIESAESAGAVPVASLREAARLILSFHDFQSTPPLAPVVHRLRRFSCDYYKVVPTATRQSDNCAVLDFLSSVSEHDTEGGKWVAFAMGEHGIPSRVLALSRGSAFIYAAPGPFRSSNEARESTAAPGQLDWDTLHNQYRPERLTNRTAIYGLLGNPVRHSVGAAIHNYAFRSCDLDAVYLPLLASDLSDFRKAASRYPLAGFSVTIPHKQSILRYVDKTDREVQAAGAANTVRLRRGRWEAINTDIDGVRIPLQRIYRLSAGNRLSKGFRAIIVGNGGSARAAFIALRALGCRSIAIAGRHPAHARRLAKEMGGEEVSLPALRRERFDLLIHATPVGMWPHHDECPLTGEQLCADTVFDLVYNPPDTRLLRMARAHGCRTISGIEMFLAQAARQFEFWTGKKTPLGQMRRIAVEALDHLRRTTAETEPRARKK
ncbi:MAG: shikimate dehydrogenase [Acidobacteria bacterium]|nr:shikimate dehydrogenase [Acidobacteriota bacterium]